MKMANIEIFDFTSLTCTNLMIKLKILLKKLPKGEILNFYSTREQYDNIKKPFRYLVEVTKNFKS
jgi:hypothetical protein